MVTSNVIPESKVVKMVEPSTSQSTPTKTLLSEVNKHLTCVLCRGYYIDATTIVECLHSFCRSCLVKHLKDRSYCPDCGVMINTAKPNIKPDKALQDIVYKLVPGLFQKEMERRRVFYASRPSQAASATPEQRGEDTERIIFSPEDVISFSLEYMDLADNESISSRSSDSSNEPPSTNPSLKRYIQCPAVVNIRQLKKFLCNKFDIDCTQFSIDILYKRVPLPDYYTLMDIAYIYNWKRNEPMRFFYQITDFTAIRNRYGLFDHKGSNFRDRKPSPTPTDDTGTSSPAPPLNDPSSDGSSGTNSPMPGDSSHCKLSGDKFNKKDHKGNRLSALKLVSNDENSNLSTASSEDGSKPALEDVEKSQFLNSFELTAKGGGGSTKSSPTKSIDGEKNVSEIKKESPKNENKTDSTKRKGEDLEQLIESKKIKIEKNTNKAISGENQSTQPSTYVNTLTSIKSEDKHATPLTNHQIPKLGSYTNVNKPSPQKQNNNQQKLSNDLKTVKRSNSTVSSLPSPKKTKEESNSPLNPQQKLPPLILTNPNLKKEESNQSKSTELSKPPIKLLPELEIANATPILPSKPTIVKGIRTDLLANNSDPTTDRRKLLAQANPNQPNVSGDSLKSLFNSCKINIPSSLSITLTDQKTEQRNSDSPGVQDQKKSVPKTNLPNTPGLNQLKTPSPPVHNYIEILKLPDSDPKKSNKPENTKPSTTQSKPEGSSAKGPVPSLKPISDTKLGKSPAFSKPTTFQQTFLQSLQQTDKQKLSKPKTPVPKLVPAIPKPVVESKDLQTTRPSQVPSVPKPNIKGDNVLDLSNPHTLSTQRTPQQNKALETMQSIADLAQKQNNQTKSSNSTAPNIGFNPNVNKNFTGIMTPIRIPSPNNQNRTMKPATPSGRPEGFQVYRPIHRQNNGSPNASTKPNSNNQPTNQQSTTNSSRASPHLQTRSPSTSPKLVIAEDKQVSPNIQESNLNQSNQISSTNVGTIGDMQQSRASSNSPKATKISKAPIAPKLANVRLPGNYPKPGSSILPPQGSNYLHSQDFLTRQALIRQMEMQQIGQFLQSPAQWLKMNEALMKSMANQNDFNRDKK